MWDEDGTDKRALSIMIGRKNLPSRLQLIFYCLGRKSQWGGVKIATVVYLPHFDHVCSQLLPFHLCYISLSPWGGLFLSCFILSFCEPLVRMEATFFFHGIGIWDKARVPKREPRLQPGWGTETIRCPSALAQLPELNNPGSAEQTRPVVSPQRPNMRRNPTIKTEKICTFSSACS